MASAACKLVRLEVTPYEMGEVIRMEDVRGTTTREREKRRATRAEKRDLRLSRNARRRCASD